MDRILKSSFSFTKATATAGTKISQLIAPNSGAKVRVTNLQYKASTTAHTLTAMRCLGNGTVQTATVASGTTITVDTASCAAAAMTGDVLSAGDFIVYQYTDGTYELNTVGSVVAGTGVITLGTALQAVKTIAAGTTVWYMGVAGDTGHIQLPADASTLMTYQDPIAGVAVGGVSRDFSNVNYSRSGYGDPMIIQSDNATAAGTLYSLSGYWAKY